MDAQELFNQALNSHYEVCQDADCTPDNILEGLVQEVTEA